MYGAETKIKTDLVYPYYFLTKQLGPIPEISLYYYHTHVYMLNQ